MDVNNKTKHFVIVMGDSEGKFLKEIKVSGSGGSKSILDGTQAQGWRLISTDKANYWILSDIVKNLTHQFMHYKKPIIYILVNFSSQNHLEVLEQNYTMIRQNLLLPKYNIPQKILVIGLNYRPNFNEKMKIKVLEWCVDTEKKIKSDKHNLTIEYTDFEKIDSL